MMNEEILVKFEKIREAETILNSTVRLVEHNEELDTDILMVDIDGFPGIIMREDLDVVDIKSSLVPLLGKKIKFVIKEIDRDKGVLICSRKVVREKAHEELITKLENEETFSAKITKILPHGAYVKIKGVTAFIHNRNFADDYTAISDIKKEGDIINVKLNKITKNRKILVEAIEKYKIESIMSIDRFEKNKVVLGIVRNVKPHGAYVCIAPGLDALCPVPETFDIEKGMKVSFRIIQVRPEENRVRGKIVNIIHNDDEDED